jgi:hypothetical protein
MRRDDELKRAQKSGIPWFVLGLAPPGEQQKDKRHGGDDDPGGPR